MSAADDFFGGGSPSAKFETVGTVVGGPVTRISDAVQQTDFQTKKPLFWDDGKPRMQLPVTVQTDLRDPSDPSDDGQRTLWVKGQMKKAIETALRQAGAKLEIGGVLQVAFVGEEPSKAGNPKKLYEAQYTKPVAGAGGFFDAPAAAAAPTAAPAAAAAPPWGAGPATAPAPAAAPAAPVAAPAAAPAQVVDPASMTPEQVAMARSMGLIA